MFNLFIYYRINSGPTSCQQPVLSGNPEHHISNLLHLLRHHFTPHKAAAAHVMENGGKGPDGNEANIFIKDFTFVSNSNFKTL
jgi:hypothetical protein